MSNQHAPPCFREHPWRLRYRSTECDILHDFYLPALQSSVRYDRVAGFFRSTSLAAASQGFTAMARRGGRIRLVVGADLDPADVQAVIDDRRRARLAEALEWALGDPRHWPRPVADGLGLLCWLLEKGYLEIRVALRRHRQTGEGLPFDSAADGYVHEKWALFEDACGHRLLAEGSFNESRTALVINAENFSLRCDWESERERAAIEDASAAFARIWNDQEPGLKVLPLPEAVRRRLIAIGRQVRLLREIDGSQSLPVDGGFQPSPEEWLRFAILRDAPNMPGGRYVGIETAPVAPWPHQAIVARRLVETWPYSFLLCDEVGLGKTIEAGLALRALILSGQVRRVLIAAPASLTRQWQNELADKCLLDFARAATAPRAGCEHIHPQARFVAQADIFAAERVIVSTGLVRRRERRRQLAGKRWDVVLVDEAHYARRQNVTAGLTAPPRYGDLYQALQDILRRQGRALWLATATPMQLEPIEVHDLLRLTRRAGIFLEDPTLTFAYYDVLAQLVQKHRLPEPDTRFLRRSIAAMQKQDPPLWRDLHDVVLGHRARLFDSWLKRGSPALPQESYPALFQAAPLSRVMMRHTRELLEVYRDHGQLKANLARRRICPLLALAMSEPERSAYAELRAYTEELAQQLNQSEAQTRVSVGFYRSFLERRFSSSLYAIEQTLKRRRQRVADTLAALQGGQSIQETTWEIEAEGEEDEELERQVVGQLLKNRTLQDLSWELNRLDTLLSSGHYDGSRMTSKVKALLAEVERRRQGHRIRQMVVFTQFKDTLDDLLRRFRGADPTLRVGAYSGQGGGYVENGHFRPESREAVRHRFLRGEIDLLLCTDAAAEGLNLQTADLLVNFDLPWNPAKVEQRIGRIDRIGQTHGIVEVLNLCYLDSVEEIVYGRLWQRLQNANLLVGSQPVSLLPVEEEDFRRLLEGETGIDQLEQMVLEKLRRFQERIRKMELGARELYRIYQRLRRDHTPPPVTLDGIWKTLTASDFLRSQGCRPLLEGRALELAGQGVITADRQLYEAGDPALAEGQLAFASYGSAAFDAILQATAAWPMPPGIRRLVVQPPGMAFDYIGYAVAVVGEPNPRLVTSLAQVDSLKLDASRSLTDEDITPLKEALQKQAEREFTLNARVPHIEAINQEAAKAQQIVNLGIAYGLLEGRRRLHQGLEDFGKELEAVRTFVTERLAQTGSLKVANVPQVVGRYVQPADLPFQLQLEPQPGGELRIAQVPEILLQAALATAERLGKRSKRARPTTTAVLRAIQEALRDLTS